MELKTKWKGHKDAVTCIACSFRKGKNRDDDDVFLVATSSEDGICRVWNGITGKTVRCIVNPTKTAINSVEFCPVNKEKLFLAVDAKVYEFDLSQLPESMLIVSVSQAVHYYELNEDEVNQLNVHPRGKYLAACDDAGEVKIIDLDQKRLFKTLKNQHENICNTAKFRPKSSWDMASGGFDSKLLSWDFSKGRCKNQLDTTQGRTDLQQGNQTFNPPFVHSIEYHPDGRHLVAAVGDSSILIVDQSSFEVLYRLEGHSAAVCQVHFSTFDTQDMILFSIGNDAKLIAWNYDAIMRGEDNSIIASVELSHMPNWVTTAPNEKLIYLADVSNNVSVYSL